MDLCGEPDIILEIRKGRVQLLGHVERMPEERKTCLRISNKGKSLLERQERDGWTIL